ncbi:RNA polymerase sigma-70 factor (ECF subfamily) [Rhizobium pisi]
MQAETELAAMMTAPRVEVEPMSSRNAQSGSAHPKAQAVADSAMTAERTAFDQLTRETLKEIRLHCYRIMGSLSDAEDMAQETFARAWRSRGDLADQAHMRPWLYRIATNACLDALRRHKRERRLWGDPVPKHIDDFVGLGVPDLDIAWLEPLPDSALSMIADEAPSPHTSYELAESVRLAFLACVQLLPARQRAIFLLFEVLGWSAADVASAFAITPQAANSGLQRARRAFDAAYRHEPKWAAASDVDRQVAARYAAALENRDLDAFVSLLRTDATLRMPPWRTWLSGSDVLGVFMRQAIDRWSEFRGQVLQSNGRRAVALYVRTAGDEPWRPHSLNVLEVSEGAISSIVAFVGPLAPSIFANAGLPMHPI